MINRFHLNPKTTLVLKYGMVLALTLANPFPSQAGNVDAILKAFESNKGYVQPFATIFGSMTNSGWYQSSAVPEGFGFYLGLPINLTTLSDADRSFSWKARDTGCVAYHANTPGARSQVCQENSSYDAPTLFGRKQGPVTLLSVYNKNSNTIIDTIEIPLSDGKSEVSSFNWLPFFSPQLSFSYKYTELKLRYIGLPLDAYSFSMPGIGIQHDLASFLPPLPVSISVAANFTWLSASWTPGENIKGSMDLSGQSQFYGVLAGYTYKNWLEVFVETGWESASIKSSGSLVIHDPATVDPEPDEIVKPHLDLEGRNGFRAGLNIAFHLGYDAVIGQNIGAQLGNQMGVLAYRFKK
jgi:hypothetical protein